MRRRPEARGTLQISRGQWLSRMPKIWVILLSVSFAINFVPMGTLQDLVTCHFSVPSWDANSWRNTLFYKQKHCSPTLIRILVSCLKIEAQWLSKFFCARTLGSQPHWKQKMYRHVTKSCEGPIPEQCKKSLISCNIAKLWHALRGKSCLWAITAAYNYIGRVGRAGLPCLEAAHVMNAADQLTSPPTNPKISRYQNITSLIVTPPMTSHSLHENLFTPIATAYAKLKKQISSQEATRLSL